jgi:hypothetical protein
MRDPVIGDDWLPLTPASFEELGITKIVTGYKIA